MNDDFNLFNLSYIIRLISNVVLSGLYGINIYIYIYYIIFIKQLLYDNDNYILFFLKNKAITQYCTD